MLHLLLAVLVVCVILWATRALTIAFRVPEPFRTLILVVVVVVALLWLLGLFGIPMTWLR
jgi:hypothetical protein